MISSFVLAMALIAAWMATPDGARWALIAALYALNATAVLMIARRSPGGGLVPFGTLGDSRFALALLALVLATAHQTPAYQATGAYAALPFWMMLTASALCGLADGGWVAVIMRHGRVSFRQALVLTARRISARKDGMVQFMAGRPAS